MDIYQPVPRRLAAQFAKDVVAQHGVAFAAQQRRDRGVFFFIGDFAGDGDIVGGGAIACATVGAIAGACDIVGGGAIACATVGAIAGDIVKQAVDAKLVGRSESAEFHACAQALLICCGAIWGYEIA
jgi:hypothetical protein